MAGETYTPIADSEIDPESAGTSPLFYKLRDNPLAMAIGAAGAPKISPAALSGSYVLSYLGTGADGSKTVATNEDLAKGEYHYTDLTINAGQTLGCSAVSGGFLILRVQGLCTIAGHINLSGKGGLGGVTAPIASDGLNGDNGNGGGSGGGGGAAGGAGFFGGDGGNSSVDANTILGGAGAPNTASDADSGLAVSARMNRSEQAGSGVSHFYLDGGGGASGGNANIFVVGYKGGNGGGSLIIIANEIDFQAGATIDCSGEDTPNTSDANFGSGGGGGGGVAILKANTITNNGSIDVSGGVAGIGGGAASDGGDGGAGLSAVLS